MSACGFGDLSPSVPQSLVLPGWWWLEPVVSEPERPALFAHDGALITRRSLAAAVDGAGRASGSGRSGSDGPPGGGDGPRGGPGDLFARWDGGGSRSSPGAVEPPGIVLDDLCRLRATHVLVDGDPLPRRCWRRPRSWGLPLLHIDPLASATEPVARLTVPVVADFIGPPPAVVWAAGDGDRRNLRAPPECGGDGGALRQLD